MANRSLNRGLVLIVASTTALSALTSANGQTLPVGDVMLPGNYAVTVSLELPNLDDTTAKRTATICISQAPPPSVQDRGLRVLSTINPLGTCPSSNYHSDGRTITFDIICPGGNAAIGNARLTLQPNTFQGRITMKMGGKNMTMTEVQSGVRIGDCP